MQELDMLRDRINTLLKKHAALIEKNKSLQLKIRKQEEQIEDLDQQLEACKLELLATAVAGMLPDAAVKEETRKKLDAVISGIDKVLTQLND